MIILDTPIIGSTRTRVTENLIQHSITKILAINERLFFFMFFWGFLGGFLLRLTLGSIHRNLQNGSIYNRGRKNRKGIGSGRV